MIRIAKPADTENILVMMRHYRELSLITEHKNSDENTTKTVINNVLLGMGIIFLAENSAGTVGMLMAIRNPNIWDNRIIAMNELIYWVEPEHRKERLGMDLLKTYIDYCNDLIEKKKIHYFTLSQRGNAPDMGYERFGFIKLEETFICQPL